MFKTILVAYDGSEHAQNALACAAELAKTQAAKLHLVHTPQLDTPPIVIGSYVSQLGKPPSKEEIAEAGSHIAKQATEEAKSKGMDLEQVHLSNGVPADFILATAKAIDADLIVLGRRGLGSLGSLVLGSVSQAVTHGTTCACLTVV